MGYQNKLRNKIFRVLLPGFIVAFVCLELSSSVNAESRGKYDLSEYFFHKNLAMEGGSVEYTIEFVSRYNTVPRQTFPTKWVRNGPYIEVDTESMQADSKVRVYGLRASILEDPIEQDTANLQPMKFVNSRSITRNTFLR